MPSRRGHVGPRVRSQGLNEVVGDAAPLADQAHHRCAARALRHLRAADQLSTVPRGTARLRLTPTPQHSDADFEGLVAALSTLWTELSLPLEDQAQAAE